MPVNFFFFPIIKAVKLIIVFNYTLIITTFIIIFYCTLDYERCINFFS